MTNRYTFTDEVQAQVLIDALDENHTNSISKQGFKIIEPATYTEDEIPVELTPVVYGTEYFVEVVWKQEIPTEWESHNVLMDGEQSVFSGQFYETRKSRLKRLIKKGVLVVNGSETYWFDEQTLNSFITMKLQLEKLGSPAIEWKAINKQWYQILMAQANTLIVTGMTAIQNIYKNN